MARKQVAVFVANLYSDMVRQTVEGVAASARAHDVKLLFFTGFTDNFSSLKYARYKDYDTGDFVVYLLADLDRLDGLLTFDTYMPALYMAPIDRLKASSGCPVITLGAEKPGACSVVNDQARSMREVIEHVITRHGCRDLVHIAGRREMTFTWERIDIFRQTLTEHGLPAGEERILFGSLGMDCGEPMVEALLSRRDGQLPDAIICANDFTAIGVIQALERRGFAVPGDVIVTGYDGMSIAQFNEPSVTTSAQPFARVGQAALDTLARLWQGDAVRDVIALPGELLCRQSCGCVPMRTYKKDASQDRFIHTLDRLEGLVQSNTNLILGASTSAALEDIFDEIQDCLLRETGFTDAALCLLRGWDQKKIIRDRSALADKVFDVACGLWHGRSVKRRPLPKGELLPEETRDDPESCFLFPVHHLQYFMGYLVVRADLGDMGQLHIKSWLASLGIILENWSIRRQLTDSVAELERLYQTDMLTGLANRRGYYRGFGDYYRQCREAGARLAVFQIDMDGMKPINDRYGHAEGDYCLRAIADAMRACDTGRELCARTGGDEFVVLARHYDEESADDYVRALREALEQRCLKDGKPYAISVSIGRHIALPKEVDPEKISAEAERFLCCADEAMYAEKRARHAGRDG